MKTNPSRLYLANLTLEERKDLAQRIGRNATYLYNIGKGFKDAGLATALKLEKATGGRVRVEDFVAERRG